MTEEEYWYWFTNIWDGQSVNMRRLLEHFRSPEEIYKAPEKALCKCVDEETADRILQSKKLIDSKFELDRLKEKNIEFIHINSENYPARLKNIYDSPYSLYVKGKIPIDNIPSVAIIGARACTSYGISVAEKISSDLAGMGIQIVSGMAKGIDGAAHRGSVNVGKSTYAVLGCGVDICYPRDNINIYVECQKSGGIISEYNIGKEPAAWRFPQRNRIISGLSDVIIVVEAREKSGSLITVEAALEQGKDVYAVPGRLGDRLSEGCNRLIKAGAGIYTGVEDVLSELQIKFDDKNEIFQKNELPLEKDLQVLYSCLDLFPKSIDSIMEETGYEAVDVMQLIVQLQLMDLIDEPIKNYYIKKI